MTEKRHTGAISRPYTIITRQGTERVDGAVINEQLVCIYVNGQELAAMMCTPCQLDAFALGFLVNEGIDSISLNPDSVIPVKNRIAGMG